MDNLRQDELELGVPLDPGCADHARAIGRAAVLLIQGDAASEECADAVVAREREFPMGLPAEPTRVALPRVDRGVWRPAAAWLPLQEPVLLRGTGTTGGRQIPRAVVSDPALQPRCTPVEPVYRR